MWCMTGHIQSGSSWHHRKVNLHCYDIITFSYTYVWIYLCSLFSVVTISVKVGKKRKFCTKLNANMRWRPNVCSLGILFQRSESETFHMDSLKWSATKTLWLCRIWVQHFHGVSPVFSLGSCCYLKTGWRGSLLTCLWLFLFFSDSGQLTLDTATTCGLLSEEVSISFPRKTKKGEPKVGKWGRFVGFYFWLKGDQRWWIGLSGNGGESWTRITNLHSGYFSPFFHMRYLLKLTSVILCFLYWRFI